MTRKGSKKKNPKKIQGLIKHKELQRKKKREKKMKKQRQIPKSVRKKRK